MTNTPGIDITTWPTTLTAEQIDFACAWSDYRADYGIPSGVDIDSAYLLFKGGWDSRRTEGDTRGILR